MSKLQHAGARPLSRREAIGRLAGAGFGIASVLKATEDTVLAAQAPRALASNYPPIPTWLLGMVSLESLGLILDPMKRVLRPLPMVLGGHERP